MHRALREAFESFCNRQIAGTSTAELMASYADLQLRKGEKLNEEEAEKALEKIVKLLVYINDRDVFGCAFTLLTPQVLLSWIFCFVTFAPYRLPPLHPS